MTRVGIWIDLHKAKVVRLGARDEVAIELIESRILGKAPDPRTRPSLPFHAASEERRIVQLRLYYRRVMTAADGASEILVLGPGQAKAELLAEMRRKHRLFGRMVNVERAEEMTEPQLVEHVKDFFCLGAGKSGGVA